MFGRHVDTETKQLESYYRHVRGTYDALELANPANGDQFAMDLIEYTAIQNNISFNPIFLETCFPSIEKILHREFYPRFPDLPNLEHISRADIVLLRQELEDWDKFLKNFEATLDVFFIFHRGILAEIYSVIPATSFDRNNSAQITYTSTIIEAAPNPVALLDKLFLPICGGLTMKNNAKWEYYNPFGFDSHTVINNVTDMMGTDSNKLVERGISLKKPSDFKMPLIELAGAIFKDTFLFDILTATIQIPLPPKLRFEHHHIVAGSGHGKTQLIQHFLSRDIPEVSHGKASVIILDSQGDNEGHLVNTVSRLKWFANSALKDKLVYIDPTDAEYPLALNLFDTPERLDTYSVAKKRQILTRTLDIFEYLFGAILGADMTSKQTTFFRFVARLLMLVPDATILTFIQLMDNKLYDNFLPYIKQLPPNSRKFFETEFNEHEFSSTKKQVTRRLWSVLENEALADMFSSPYTKLDLFEEMNSGKVIVINASNDYLGDEGTAIFGRFFVSLIYKAIIERVAIPKKDRLPTYVYIDECYLFLDENVRMILKQARKYNVGVILAHQELSDMPSARVLNAVHTNTHIKMAGELSARDSHSMAAEMRTEQGFIDSMPVGVFAAHMKGLTTLPFKVTLGLLEEAERLNNKEWKKIRKNMRKKYSTHISKLPNIYEHDDTLSDIDEPNNDPTKPSSNWKDDV